VQVAHVHLVLRALGSGHAGLDGVERSISTTSVNSARGGRRRATCPGRGSRPRPARPARGRGRSCAGSRWCGGRWGRGPWWRRIPGPCWRRGAVGHRHAGQAGAEVFHELFDHALGAQHAGGGPARRRWAVQPAGSLPVRRQPTTLGVSSGMGWPSMAASASMPPTPQPSTPMALIMVVCESVPTSVSGKATKRAGLVRVGVVPRSGRGTPC
jgi:hypothetical protein